MAALRTNNRGTILVEALLSSSLLLMIALFVVATVSAGRESVNTAGLRTQATFLAEEGLEAVRNIRDADYTNLVNGTYGLSTSGSQWDFSGSSDATDGFTRAVTIADGPANIKQVTSTVTWQQTPQRSGSLSLVTYLANWLIAKVTGGDWTNPGEVTTVDLSGSRNGLKIAIQGDYAYIVRSGGTDFSVIDISNPTAPTQVGSTSVSGTPSDVDVSGNYAYVSSNSNRHELIVIDISTPSSPSTVGSYNAHGKQNANAVLVNGTTVYVGRDSSDTEVFSLDVSTPSSPSLLDSIDLDGDVNGLAFSTSGGTDYLHLASSNEIEYEIYDVTTPSSMTSVGNLDFSGKNDALSVAVISDGSVAFVGRRNGQFISIDLSTISSPSELDTIDIGTGLNDIAIDGTDTYAFLATDKNTQEFQVVDISNTSAPSVVGFVDAAGDLNGVAYDGTTDTAYAVGEDNNEELVVYQPQ